MRISLVTVTYNSAATLVTTLASVASQRYPDIEHILIDGQSSDDTLAIAGMYPHLSKVVSEPDLGMYDAMNKGIRLATGDYVGILNSDDFFSDDGVVERIVARLRHSSADAVIGDVLFVSPNDLSKKLRYYSARCWHPGLFVWGFMPPHPSFYVRRSLYQQLGMYETDYRIAADYELLIRFLYTYRISFTYLPEAMVHMRAGGISNQGFKSRWILNREIIRACSRHGIRTNMFKLALKYIVKVFEYWPRTMSVHHES